MENKHYGSWTVLIWWGDGMSSWLLDSPVPRTWGGMRKMSDDMSVTLQLAD